MRKALVGALTGLCLGTVLGYVSYTAAYEQENAAALHYYRLYTSGLQAEQTPWFSTHGLVGVIHGGGLAAIAGAVIGGAGAVVEAIRENRRLALSLERQQPVPEKEHHV